MKIQNVILSVLIPICGGACAQTASSPDALAKALQKALNSGDFAAAGALADLGDAPADLHFAYLGAVQECSGGSTCTVATAPLDAAFSRDLAEDAKQEGAEPPKAEGVVVVTMKAADGSGSGELKMPFAKVGSAYRIASVHLTPAEIARRRAQTGEAQLKAMFAGGIYDKASGTRRTDWETAATRLPADGGAAGAALLKQTRAMSAAVDAKDPDAAMRSGGHWAAFVFADKGYDGKPIAIEQRRRKLQVQSLRMLRDVKVTGGYQLGDDAALIVEARNGIGWIERGAVLVSRDGDAWDVSAKQTVSYPQ